LRLLLDTQAFLYFVLDSPALGRRARDLISDPGNQRLFSIASIWEMAIKVSIGKLSLAQPFDTFVLRQMTANALTLLPIALDHAIAAARLPLHHRDPFDRMLIAQAIVEGVPLVSNDPAFDRYPVERLW
jgi:PIN domain nuclease of toxin-antitoxin system